MDAFITALRVSLAHAYYGTPSSMVPFSMTLPKRLYKPLPPLDKATHQVCLATANTRAADLQQVEWGRGREGERERGREIERATHRQMERGRETKRDLHYTCFVVSHRWGCSTNNATTKRGVVLLILPCARRLFLGLVLSGPCFLRHSCIPGYIREYGLNC